MSAEAALEAARANQILAASHIQAAEGAVLQAQAEAAVLSARGQEHIDFRQGFTAPHLQVTSLTDILGVDSDELLGRGIYGFPGGGGGGGGGGRGATSEAASTSTPRRFLGHV